MRRMSIVLLMALLASAQLAVLAHEGHEHKIMGTVAMLHENHLEVKTKDGKSTVVTMNEKTRIVRGKAAEKRDGITTGERVVVTAVETKQEKGGTIMLATEVRLAPASAPTSTSGAR